MALNPKYLLYRGIPFANNMNKFIKAITVFCLLLFSVFSYAAFLPSASTWKNGADQPFSSYSSCYNSVCSTLNCKVNSTSCTTSGCTVLIDRWEVTTGKWIITGSCYTSGAATCPSNSTLEVNGCVCNSGYIEQNGACVPELPKCPANSTLNPSTNQCDCNDGYVKDGDICVPVPNKCKAGDIAVLDIPMVTGVVSADGKSLDTIISDGSQPNKLCYDSCSYNFSQSDTAVLGTLSASFPAGMPPGTTVNATYALIYRNSGNACTNEPAPPTPAAPIPPTSSGSGSGTGGDSTGGSGTGGSTGGSTDSGDDSGPTPPASSPDGGGNGGTPSGNGGGSGSGTGSSV